MRVSNLLCLLCLCSLVAVAQPSEKKTSTVTGHVYCADTNAPARFATVMLEPASAIDRDPPATDAMRDHSGMVYTSAVQTGLDGSFTLTKIAPGSYYVIAYKEGYLSPLAEFSEATLAHPTAEEHKRMAALIPHLVVQAGVPGSIDVRLERGGAISGTVLFDDGSPASGLPVHALVRRKAGDKQVWTPLRPIPFAMMQSVATDDLGHYRLVGLTAREYLVEVDLDLQSYQFGFQPGAAGGSSAVADVASLAFYSGNVSRKRDGTPVKVGAGDEVSGTDMMIPLSKLHTVTGELTAAHDGHVIDSGDVSLLDPTDSTEIEKGKVERADGRFHLFFVPEGDYTLRVSDAADVTYEDVPYPPGTMPQTHEVKHTLRTYGTLDQPLSVHDDLANLVVSVPAKRASVQGNATPQ